MDNAVLDIRRQGRRDPVEVQPGVLQAFRLDEYLMSFLVGKADHFVLDGGAVARAGGLDLAGVHRGTVEVRADQPMRDGTSVGDMAEDLWKLELVGENGERPRVRVAMSLLHLLEVD